MQFSLTLLALVGAASAWPQPPNSTSLTYTLSTVTTQHSSSLSTAVSSSVKSTATSSVKSASTSAKSSASASKTSSYHHPSGTGHSKPPHHTTTTTSSTASIVTSSTLPSATKKYVTSTTTTVVTKFVPCSTAVATEGASTYYSTFLTSTHITSTVVQVATLVVPVEQGQVTPAAANPPTVANPPAVVGPVPAQADNSCPEQRLQCNCPAVAPTATVYLTVTAESISTPPAGTNTAPAQTSTLTKVTPPYVISSSSSSSAHVGPTGTGKHHAVSPHSTGHSKSDGVKPTGKA